MWVTASEEAPDGFEQVQERDDHREKRPSKKTTMAEGDSIGTRDKSSRSSKFAYRVGESETCAREKTR